MTTAGVERIEARIAQDLARRALLLAPAALLGVGLWRGADAAGAVALALAVIVANFWLSAALLGGTARRAPHLLLGVAMMSFVVRLALITGVGVGIKALDVVDWPVFCFTLIAAYFALLAWELRAVSFSLASPGLKPAAPRRWRGEHAPSDPGARR